VADLILPNGVAGDDGRLILPPARPRPAAPASPAGGGGGGSLALDLALALDPVALAGAAGLQLDAAQAATVRSPRRQRIRCWGRGVGKTTVLAVEAAHVAVTVPDGLAVIISASQRQSSEVHREVRRLLAALPDASDSIVEESKSALTTRIGARVLAMPASESTTRGYHGVDLLALDEAASIADDVYRGVRPMLATSRRGRLVLSSTPRGSRGFFHAEWLRSASDPSWERTHRSSEDCDRIGEAFLRQERLALGQAYDREYRAEFSDAADGALYGVDHLRSLVDPSLAPLVDDDGNPAGSLRHLVDAGAA